MGEEKKGFFRRLVFGLTKTRDNIVSGMDSIFHGFSRIDDDFYEELEETLIMGDLGVRATMDIIEDLKEKVKEQHIKERDQPQDMECLWRTEECCERTVCQVSDGCIWQGGWKCTAAVCERTVILPKAEWQHYSGKIYRIFAVSV